MLLPLRPRPMADEPLVGYMVRLAAANGRKDFLAFSRYLGMPHSIPEAAATVPFDLARFSAATGLSRGRLLAATYWPRSKGKLSFYGFPLDRRWLTLHRRRACARCLAQEDRHRAAWDLTVAAVCPIHGTALIEACPRCGSRLLWTTGPISRCRCGFPLSVEENPDSPSERDAAALRAVLAAFGLSYGGAPVARLPAAVASLEPDSLIELIFHLGWFAGGGTGRAPPARLVRSGADIDGTLSRGHAIVAAWPEGFRDFLVEIRGGADGRRGRFGARKEFGPFLTWASLLERSGSLGSLVWSETENYARGCPELCGRMDALRAGPHCRPATLGQVSRELKHSAVRVRAVLVKHGLADRGKSVGRGEPLRISQALLDGLAESGRRLLDRRAAREALGCGRRTFLTAVEAGLAPASGVAAELAAGEVWDADGLSRFVESLSDRVEPRRAAGHETPFPEALRWLRRAGYAPAVAASALALDLLPVRIDVRSPGLQGILYDSVDIRSLARRGPRAREGYSVSEAAEKLRLKEQVAHELCCRGHLRTTGGAAPGPRRVAPEEIERFESMYFVPGNGRGRPGISARALIAAGIRPVSGPSVDGGRQHIFLRSDLPDPPPDIEERAPAGKGPP